MEIRMNGNNAVLGINRTKRETGIGLISLIRGAVAKLAAKQCERQRMASAAAHESAERERNGMVKAPIVHEMCVC